MPPTGLSTPAADQTTAVFNPYNYYGKIFGRVFGTIIFLTGFVMFFLTTYLRHKWDRKMRHIVPCDHKRCRLKNLRTYYPIPKHLKKALAPVTTTSGRPITMDDSSYHPTYTRDVPAPVPPAALKQICGVETKP